MSKVDLEEVFFDFFDAAKSHISDADQLSLCIDMIRNLEDGGHELGVLKGHDDIVDEALSEVFPDLYDDDEEVNVDDEGEY